MDNHTTSDETGIDALFDDKQEFKITLTKEQIALICFEIEERIQEYQEVYDNIDKLSKDEREMTKEELAKEIRQRRIIIENLVDTHYPVFKMAYPDS